MKRFIVFCLLCVPLISFAEEDYGVNVPDWSDFAPKAFIDIKQPKGLAKLNINNQYWYERKVEFDNSLEQCKSLETSEERFSCYEILKTTQFKKNNDYNAKLEARINGTSSVPGMQSPTDSMIPIGGYLNQMTKYMPSEVN